MQYFFSDSLLSLKCFGILSLFYLFYRLEQVPAEINPLLDNRVCEIALYSYRVNLDLYLFKKL